jgi:hypothetical protein
VMASPELITGSTGFHWWPPDPVKEEVPLAR